MSPSLLIDAQTVLLTLALITPRSLICLMVIPGFGLRTLTGFAKNSAAIAFALPAALPTYAYLEQTPPGFFMMVMLIFKEVWVGAVLGIFLSIPIWVAQSIGSILDAQRSPIQIQNSNASIDKDASALGGMLVQAVVLVMVQAGLFLALSRLLIESYGAWPAFGFLPPFEPGHFDVLLKRFGEFFWHIVVYGGPVLIPLVLVDFGFAMLGAFASNLQVSFMSSPIKSMLGLFILLLYWPTFSHYVAGDFSRLIDLAASLMQAAGK